MNVFDEEGYCYYCGCHYGNVSNIKGCSDCINYKVLNTDVYIKSLEDWSNVFNSEKILQRKLEKAVKALEEIVSYTIDEPGKPCLEVQIAVKVLKELKGE